MKYNHCTGCRNTQEVASNWIFFVVSIAVFCAMRSFWEALKQRGFFWIMKVFECHLLLAWLQWRVLANHSDVKPAWSRNCSIQLLKLESGRWDICSGWGWVSCLRCCVSKAQRLRSDSGYGPPTPTLPAVTDYLVHLQERFFKSLDRGRLHELPF